MGYQSHTTTTTGTGTANNLVGTKPTGVVAGDLLIAGFGWRDATNPTNAAATAPAGWTQITGSPLSSGSTGMGFACYYRIADGSEPADYTFSLNETNQLILFIGRYDNVDSSAPINAQSAADNASTSTSVTGTSVSTTADDATLIMLAVANGTSTYTPAAGMTERVDQATAHASVNITLHVADELLGAAGATGTRIATNGSSVRSLVFVVALAPPAPEPEPEPPPTIILPPAPLQRVGTGEYKLILRRADGEKYAEVGDYTRLAYTKRVNEPDRIDIALRGNHRVISLMEDGDQVEVWRRVPRAGIAWYRDAWGFFRDDDQRQMTTAMFDGTAYGALATLAERIVGYRAGTANKSVFAGVKAATIMWQLVRDNATSAATTGNGRILNGAMPGLTVGDDPDSGPVTDIACAFAVVLAQLQRLAPRAGGDFDIVKTGAASWQWQFFPGQRGADRTETVTFAIERGNITDLRATRVRSRLRTAAVVGGPGEEESRRIRVRSAASPSRHAEVFVDARDVGDDAADAALDARGDAALEAARTLEQLSYTVLQVPSCLYGLHYGLGDLVSRRTFGSTRTQKVAGISVVYQAGQQLEQIGVELRDV